MSKCAEWIHDWRGNFRIEHGSVEGGGACADCGLTIHEFTEQQRNQARAARDVEQPDK